MVDGKPGPPKILVRRHILDIKEDTREWLEETIEQQITKLSLIQVIGKALRGAADKAPDLAVLGMGFWLGWEMNFRPGIDIPVIGFLGFPDFGGKVKELQEELKTVEEEIAKEEENLARNEEEEKECIARAREDWKQHGDSFRLARDTLACQERNVSRTRLATRDELNALLQKHRIAQGFLMSLMALILTRNLGGIIPG